MNDKRDVLSQFSHLRDVAMQVARLISDVRAHLSASREHGVLEIEARLGKMHDRGFEPDVGYDSFCRILQLLESYPRWTRVTPWQETQDVFYTVELPSEYGGKSGNSTQIRTTVGSDAHGELEVVHHTKQRLRHVDMEMRLMDYKSCSMNVTRDSRVGGFDVRVVANLERGVPSELLPIAVSTDLVRIKQRKRFFLSSLGVEGEVFSFDVSVVYSGKTKSEAERKQSQQQGPCFEVEVECLQPQEYLKSSGGEDIMLALSLILKCQDFSSALNPSASVTYVPVHAQHLSHSACD
jgi:hypothetical protein